MKPAFERIRLSCPQVAEELILEHLSRLGDRYFDAFTEDQICAHLQELSALTAEEPVRLLAREMEEGRVECTILAFDYPAEFSLLTGILAALGLQILQGDAFTWERRPAVRGPAGPPGAARLPGRPRSLPPRRRIIDRFCGTLEPGWTFAEWEQELRRRLGDTVRLLESGSSENLLQARQKVNELVAAHLVDINLPPASALYPMQIEVDEEERRFTRLRVVTEDTPFFLYALSTALALRGITIERVSIRTARNRIQDQFDLLDARGRPIDSRDLLDQVKLSVLLTKQFTYFLGRSPDPYSALFRFEQLVNDILRLPQQGRWFDLLSNPRVLQDLARLLGASDFLWEDFIRLQYESLLPMLEPRVEGRSFSRAPETLGERLGRELAGARDYEEKVRRLNEFKDREIFLLDLDHILSPGADFRELARGLTLLAEAVVEAAVGLAQEKLAARYGTPRTVAGLEARLAVLGLGKLGGGDLGYASDIELLFVYSDNGRTSAASPAAGEVGNAEYFNLLAREVALLIRAKREGIFQVDLRLRPYGASGPLACSLESFCRYYGSGGEASALERLALVRLRAVAGDRQLGARVERLRDEMIYGSRSIDLAELRAMRERQLQNKVAGRGLNAKFSPGALVDLEYTVQILQVMYGAEHRSLRTPRIWEALDELARAGLLDREEAERISAAYGFFRRLINSLRMLRGSAQDLFLPPEDSHEYAHLARRMGYAREGTARWPALSAGRQPRLDFEAATATIRTFVKRHLGRDSLPGPEAGNVADLLLAPESAALDEPARSVLLGAGFRDPGRALVNLRKLATGRLESFLRLAILAVDILKHQPDPDMALNNWERFARSLPDRDEHYRRLLSQPRGLELLLAIFSTSQFLADTLIGNPEFLGWVMQPEILHQVRRLEEMEEDLRALSRRTAGRRDWLDGLRRQRRREVLRIGARDICLGVPSEEIIRELSNLAEALIRASLERILGEGEGSGEAGEFFILAYGKLGGRELNYSSDLDLLGVTVAPDPGGRFRRMMAALRADLSGHTAEGYAYRVDLRLRPYGSAGELVVSRTALLQYLRRSASPWELQALLKARPVAGSLEAGESFIAEARALLLEAVDPGQVFPAIRRLRARSIRQASRGPGAPFHLKQDPGGIRDVEFLVQGLQLVHARRDPRLMEANTLAAIEALRESRLLSPETASGLREDYIFLRKVEHSLQLFEDRQVHALPADAGQMEALARRVLGPAADARQLLARLEETRRRVSAAFEAAAGPGL